MQYQTPNAHKSVNQFERITVNLPTYKIDFIRWRVGVSELVCRRVDWLLFEKVTKPKPCDKLKILQNTPIYPDGISWPLKMGN